MSGEFQGVNHEIGSGAEDSSGSKTTETETSDTLNWRQNQIVVQQRNAASTAALTNSSSASSSSSSKESKSKRSKSDSRRISKLTIQDENRRSNEGSEHRVKQRSEKSREHNGNSHSHRKHNTASKDTTQRDPIKLVVRRTTSHPLLDNSVMWWESVKGTSAYSVEPGFTQHPRPNFFTSASEQLRQIAQSHSESRKKRKRDHRTDYDLRSKKKIRSDTGIPGNESKNPIKLPEFSNSHLFTRHLQTINLDKEEPDDDPSPSPPNSPGYEPTIDDEGSLLREDLSLDTCTNDGDKDSESEKEKYVPNNARRYEYIEIDLTGEPDSDEEMQRSLENESTSASKEVITLHYQLSTPEPELGKIQKIKTWTPPVAGPVVQPTAFKLIPNAAPSSILESNSKGVPFMMGSNSSALASNSNATQPMMDSNFNAAPTTEGTRGIEKLSVIDSGLEKSLEEACRIAKVLINVPSCARLLSKILSFIERYKGGTMADATTNTAESMVSRSSTGEQAAIPEDAVAEPNVESPPLGEVGTGLNVDPPDEIGIGRKGSVETRNTKSSVETWTTVVTGPEAQLNIASSVADTNTSSANTDDAIMKLESFVKNQATETAREVNSLSAAPPVAGCSKSFYAATCRKPSSSSSSEKQATAPAGAVRQLNASPPVALAGTSANAQRSRNDISSSTENAVDAARILLTLRKLRCAESPGQVKSTENSSASPGSQNEDTDTMYTVVRSGFPGGQSENTETMNTESGSTLPGSQSEGTSTNTVIRLGPPRTQNEGTGTMTATANMSAPPGRQNEVQTPGQGERGNSRRPVESNSSNRSSGQIGAKRNEAQSTLQWYLFFCCVCHKGFKDFRALRTHEDWHKKGFRYICKAQGCEKKFRLESWYKTHTTLNHASDKRSIFVCPLCDKTFLLGYNLRDHIRSHTSEEPLECPDCGQHFKLEHCLTQHQFRCPGRRNLPRVHYTCPECRKVYTTKSSRTTHRIKAHGFVLPPKPTPAVILTCKRCSFKTSNGTAGLVEHIRQVNSRNGCSQCCQLFENPEKLLDHMKETHGPSPSRPHVCATCYTNFPNRAELERHLETHSMVKREGRVSCAMKSQNTIIMNQSGGIFMDPKHKAERATKKVVDEADDKTKVFMNPLFEPVTPPGSPTPKKTDETSEHGEVNEFAVYITSFCDSIAEYC